MPSINHILLVLRVIHFDLFSLLLRIAMLMLRLHTPGIEGLDADGAEGTTAITRGGEQLQQGEVVDENYRVEWKPGKIEEQAQGTAAGRFEAEVRKIRSPSWFSGYRCR
jgi:hypothetical protein